MNKRQEPRLRFKGFMETWEEKTLNDVSEIFEYGLNAQAVNFDGVHKYIRITDIDDESRQFLQENVTSPDVDFSKADNYKLQKGDLLFARTGASVGKSYLYNENDGLVYFAGFLIRAKLNKEVDDQFIFQNTLTNHFNRFVTLTSQRSGQPGINSKEYSEFEFLAPTLPEQTHLGLFFSRLDSQIAESRAVLEKKRQLKKAMLAKMFPANGEKIPKIRFKGFEGEWERNELGCLGYCLSGIGFSENEQGGANGIPFFKVSDMNLSGNEVYLRKANNYVTQEQIDKQRWQVIQQLPCIFFAKVGAALLLNRKRLVNTPFLLDNNTMAFILDSSLDNYFMKTLFDTIDLPALAQIGALPSINAKDIEKNVVFIPTPKEQTAIGNFFRQLDETIALQSAEVEKLNQLKKGLLAVMLV